MPEQREEKHSEAPAFERGKRYKRNNDSIQCRRGCHQNIEAAFGAGLIGKRTGALAVLLQHPVK